MSIAVPADARNVMASRASPTTALDYFPTPPWATRALCEWLQGKLAPLDLADMHVDEPACGGGHMARALGEYFGLVTAADIHDYGVGVVADFLAGEDHYRGEWIITNPPFSAASAFVRKALAAQPMGVAMLVRTAFLEGARRHRDLFVPTPPTHVLQFVERVPMHAGRLVEKGSTATAYSWLVWMPGEHAGTALEWIAPCRKRLERPGDYA